MLTLQNSSIHCETGGFFVDPSRRVDLAVITHAHGDHARRGSKHYLAERDSVPLLRERLGPNTSLEALVYGEKRRLGGAEISLHPAGHILGSAQVRIETDEGVAVVSGDYKRQLDPTCAPFEVQRCDLFITEATFGHPAYEWPDTGQVVREIRDWWMENASQGKNSLLYCYALGKTQRVLGELRKLGSETVFLHGEAGALTDHYRASGVEMAPTERLETWEGGPLKGELIIASHAINRSEWIRKLGYPQTAFASGWMLKGTRQAWRPYGRGFVLSDHADWPGLLRTIEETGASQVRVIHALDDSLVMYLRKQGVDAAPLCPEAASRLEPIQGQLFQSQASWGGV